MIVTSELTTGAGDYQGLPPTLHIIYARVTNTRKDGSSADGNPRTSRPPCPVTTSTRIPRAAAAVRRARLRSRCSARPRSPRVVELLDPRLFASTAPHPTLLPSSARPPRSSRPTSASPLVPFLLIALRFQSARATALLGDVAARRGSSPATRSRVGLALGRWQDRLLPYLPHLPLEYLAIAAAAAPPGSTPGVNPIGGRGEQLRACRRLRARGVVLLALAASVEVLADPTPLMSTRTVTRSPTTSTCTRRCGGSGGGSGSCAPAGAASAAAAGDELTIHHRNYKRLGRERRSDIQVLCWPCHRAPARRAPAGGSAASGGRRR